MFLHADSKDSDQTGQMDAQADLSLCWAHMSFCWFCHVVTQISNFKRKIAMIL